MITFLDRAFGAFLGIEFQEDSIAFTFLKNTLLRTVQFSSESFPLRDDDSSLSEIKEYLTRYGAIKGVFVCIPDSWVITKFIRVPSAGGVDALSRLMRFEIERHIPFHIEEVFYDFQVMGKGETDHTVAFVVVPKERVEYVREFLEKLSLRPDGITSTSFAVLNVIEQGDVIAKGRSGITSFLRGSSASREEGEVVISLYSNRTEASLTIIRNGICIHTKSFSLEKPELAESFLDILTTYLKGKLSELAIEGPDRIILVGDIPEQGFPEALKERLDAPTLSVDQMDGITPSYGACLAGIGSGRYSINVLSQGIGHGVERAIPLSTKALIGLILFLVMGIFTTEAVRQKNFLARIEETLKKNEPGIRAIEDLSSEIKALEGKRDFLLGVRKGEISLEILAELTRLLPEDTWITNLNYKGFDLKNRGDSRGEVIISGLSSSASRLVSILEDSPYFEQVEFVGPIRKQKAKEGFKLRASVILSVSHGGE